MVEKSQIDQIPLRRVALEARARLSQVVADSNATIDALSSLLTQAFEDRLTKIYNSSALEAFLDHVAQELTELSLFFIDLNRFKALNTDLGHSGGDAALQKVGGILLELCKEEGIPFRLGGDEFVVLGTLSFAETFKDSVSRSFQKIEVQFGNKVGSVSGSIGYELWEGDLEVGLRDVRRRAEQACKKAKASEDMDGKVLRWTPEMESEPIEDLRDRCFSCDATVSVNVRRSKLQRGLSQCPNCGTSFSSGKQEEEED